MSDVILRCEPAWASLEGWPHAHAEHHPLRRVEDDAHLRMTSEIVSQALRMAVTLLQRAVLASEIEQLEAAAVSSRPQPVGWVEPLRNPSPCARPLRPFAEKHYPEVTTHSRSCEDISMITLMRRDDGYRCAQPILRATSYGLQPDRIVENARIGSPGFGSRKNSRPTISPAGITFCGLPNYSISFQSSFTSSR